MGCISCVMKMACCVYLLQMGCVSMLHGSISLPIQSRKMASRCAGLTTAHAKRVNEPAYLMSMGFIVRFYFFVCISISSRQIDRWITGFFFGCTISLLFWDLSSPNFHGKI